MTSVISNITKASQKTQKILEDLTLKSETTIMKLEGNVDQTTMNNAWAAFGLYLSKQIRMGRAINIPKFGVVTFAAPEVKMEGVTNPELRDIRLRKPVFIINKDFAKGFSIRSGIYADFGVRPFSLTGVTGGFGQAKANYTEIAAYAGLTKDITRVCIERIIRELAEKARTGTNVEMEIPNLGTFYIKGSIAAINFLEYLVNEAIDATNKTVKERKMKLESTSLTAANIQQFLAQNNTGNDNPHDTLEIDQSAQNYLRTMLGINTNDLKALSKPIASEETFSKTHNNFHNDFNIFEAKSAKSIGKFNYRPATTYLENHENHMKLAPISDLEKIKKKIKFWIRNKSLLSEELFYEIVSHALGLNKSIDAKLTLENFEKGIKKINGLNLERSEIHSLFNHLDDQSQHSITLTQWRNEFPNDGDYLTRIKNIITKYNLQCDDVLRRIGLQKDSLPMNNTQMTTALSKLDPSLSEIMASHIAIDLMKDKDTMEIRDFLITIGCSLDDGTEKTGWYKQKLVKIKKTVGIEKLRTEFEKYDEKSQGILDFGTFKGILMKMNVGISNQEINKFTKFIEKDINMNIDYYKFLKLMEDTKGEDDLKIYTANKDLFIQDEVSQISTMIANYFIESKISPIKFLKKIQERKRSGQTGADDLFSNKRVTKEDLSDMLYNLFKEQVFNKNVFIIIAGLMDLDHDGIIDENDLYIYLSRYGYIDFKASIKNNFIDINKASEIFPREPLSEQKVEILLKDLRQILNRKRISYYDFVRQIDTNEVGFISINKLSAGLDKIMKLSQPAKDGFFAYLDKQKIGLVDPKDLLKVLNRTVIDKNVEVTEDNFDWQNQVVTKIKQWSVEKKLKPEDAFRIMDVDFDGSVSKKDLTAFLKEVIKLPSSEISSPRIDRLYKLLDVFKRDDIQFNDIKRLFDKDDENNNNDVVSGGKSLNGRSNLDWKVHAKQQLGLALSKKFQSLPQSFEQISLHTMKLTYKHFSTWVEENMALSGFNLTEKLMHQLFADLDPHKKGYLSQLDWENAFGGYHVDSQIFSEIQDVLNSNFASVNDAFDYFLENEKSFTSLRREITINGLRASLNSLLPKRFNSSQINWLWSKIAEDSETLDLPKFRQKFGNAKFFGPKKINFHKISPNHELMNKSLDASSLIKNERKMLFSSQNFARNCLTRGDQIVTTKQEKQEKVCEKMKTILNAANIPIEDFYRRMDTDNTGYISTLEFINAIKRLNLGLTLQEIEDIVNHCDRSADGKIGFNEFMKKFQPNVNDNRIFDRSRNKLKKIKENIYSYMLSPKDAFLQFNEDRTGKLTYIQFNKLIMNLCHLAGEEAPTFSIVKDLFDFIDIRKDGIIDLTEWMQSFRLVESDTHSEGKLFGKRAHTVGNTLWARSGEFLPSMTQTKPVQNESLAQIRNKEKVVNSSSKAYRIPTILSEWECTKEYDEVMRIIGRNRKILIGTFSELTKSGTPVTFQKAKEVLVELLRNNGITINEEYWPYLLKAAEKDSIIDYKFLLDVFKERCKLLVSHPKSNAIVVVQSQ